MPVTRGGIAYETLGDPSAPPVLLVMGLSLSARGWDRLPRLLAEKFHVITFDNRGTGGSPKRGLAFRMSQLADDAAEVLDAAGIAQAHVFGISMGGMIAQELALRHPERLRSLVLGCTFAGWRSAARPALRTRLELLLLSAGRRFRLADRIGRVLVSRDFHLQNPRGALEWVERAGRTTTRWSIAQMLAIRAHACDERLDRIRAPTLVLTGSADRLVPPENSRVLAEKIPGARLHVLEGAGHVFPLEREAETLRLITDHFLSHEVAKRGAAI